MSSPFLDLAIGGLRGAKGNRAERIAAEERRRKQQREDMALRLQLADLAANPEFDISQAGQFPFVDAATGGGAAPAVAAPAAPPPPGAGTRGPLPEFAPEEGLEELPPVVGGGPGASAGAAVPGAPPAQAPRPGAPPPSPGGPATPFLDAGLDLGEVEVGGQKFGVRARPGRTRQRAEQTNRAAYEALHQADPEAYPTFIENMPEGYYGDELSDYAQGVRAGRIEDKRAAREGRSARAREAAEARRDAARDEVFRLAQEGKSFEEVAAEIAADGQLRGALTRSEIRREMASAGQVNAPDRETAARLATLKVQLGKPPTPRTGHAPIDAELQRDVLEALAEGHTGEEVLEALGDSPATPTVQRWLRRGRQLSRPVP